MMDFIDVIITWFKTIGDLLSDGFNTLMDFMKKPFELLFYFFDGVFYFITQLFNVVVKIIQLFTALFQFVFSLIIGLLRTAQDLLTPSFNTGDVYMPSSSSQGFNVFLDVVGGAGFLTVVPYILLAIVWSAFIFKMLSLFGSSGRGSD